MFHCLGADWRPTVGDPTVFGWLTVLSYLICAILAAILWHKRPERALRRFWAVTTLLLAFLALNKQLDLQTAFTSTLRCMSMDQGWYGLRQLGQLIFVLVMIAVSFLLYWRGARAMRRYRKSHRLAMIGLGFVVAYVLIRATSFHWIDMLGRMHVGGASTNFLVENLGLLLIAINAIGLLNGRITVEAMLLTPDTVVRRPRPASTAQPVSAPRVPNAIHADRTPLPPAKIRSQHGTVKAPNFPVKPIKH